MWLYKEYMHTYVTQFLKQFHCKYIFYSLIVMFLQFYAKQGLNMLTKQMFNECKAKRIQEHLAEICTLYY